MVDLYSFLKNSTVVDFAFIFGTVFVSILLIIVGIVMLFVAKTRKFFFVYVAFALLPIILALAATGVRWYGNDRLMKLNEIDPSSPQAAAIKQQLLPEYVLMVLIGAGCSAVPLLIGIAGIIIKKTQPGETNA
jgi:glucan phosphoethanolaminetransferase (alkaline phosphatase superfamily)